MPISNFSLTKKIVAVFSVGFISLMGMSSASASEKISPYIVGQNAWMPDWRGGNLTTLWDEIGQANFKLIRIGGNGAMLDNQSYSKIISLIDGVKSTGAEPIVQVPHIYSTQQTIDYVRYINDTMGKNVKFWSIGNEPILNKVGDAAYIGTYIRRIGSAIKLASPNAIVLGPDEAGYHTALLSAVVGGYADITGKDANGNYPVDVIAWHRYQTIDAKSIEVNVDDMRSRLAVVNAKRPADKQLTWAITEINTHYNMDMVSPANPDQYTWSFFAGQYFAELYDLGMRKGGFTISPWAIFEHSGSRSGTDLSIFDNDFSPRSTYHHSSMLGQNIKKNYFENKDNQLKVTAISMGDETGQAVMILNKDKLINFPYSLKMDYGSISANPLQISVNANINAEVRANINASTTHMIVFCPNGKPSKRYIYSETHAIQKTPPTIQQFSNCQEDEIDTFPGAADLNENNDLQPQSPYKNTLHKVPGIIQAEEYDLGGQSISYHDTTAKNNGSPFRSSQSVDIGTTTDGYYVGWIDSGEWLEYSIDVPVTTAYDVKFKVANLMTTPGSFHLAINDKKISPTISVNATGGWDTWSTLTVSNIVLPKGRHRMRLFFEKGPFNIDSMEFTSSDSAPTLNFVQPTANAVISTDQVQFKVTAYDQDFGTTDGNGINSVKFQLLKDNKFIAEHIEYTADYGWNFNAANYPDGYYSVIATASSTGPQGVSTSSKTLNFTIKKLVLDNPPTINFTLPTEMLDLKGTVRFQVTAFDQDFGTENGAGIEFVKFKLFNGTQLIAERIEQLKEYEWYVDSKAYPNGNYKMVAVTHTKGANGFTRARQALKFNIKN